MTHYIRLGQKNGNSLERVPSNEGRLGEGVNSPSLQYSKGRTCMTSSVLESHYWLPIHTHIVHIYETIKFYQFFYSWCNSINLLYNIYLYNQSLYNKRLYNVLLYNISMSQTNIPDEILDDNVFEEMAIWNSEEIKQQEELNVIQSEEGN